MVTSSLSGKRRQRHFKKVQPSPSHQIMRTMSLFVCIFFILSSLVIAALGFIPRHPTQVMPFSAHSTQRSIPVYLLNNGVHIDLAVPAYQIVSLPQGKFSINYSALFSFENQVIAPVFLPSALIYPPLTDTALQTALDYNTKPFSLQNEVSLTSAPITISNIQRWCIIGWGQLDFYKNTPTWSDVRPKTLLKAALGAKGAIHVYDHSGSFFLDKNTHLLMLSENEYIALYKYIQKSLEKDAKGALIPAFQGAGYSTHDKFFHSTDSFSAFYTCNSWVSDALKAAGYVTPTWTILPWFTMHHIQSD